MEQLKAMKQCLTAQAQSQMSNLQNVDAKELGEVIDMIKDLEEAIYYCTIVKAMEDKETTGQNNNYYYTEYRPPYDQYRDMDIWSNRMYYDGGMNDGSNSNGGGRSGNSSGNSYYQERYYDPQIEMRDRREGRSPMKRKMYMESKQMHKDKAKQLVNLESYMQDLTADIVEMIEDATPEEKQLLQQKVATLASKIS